MFRKLFLIIGIIVLCVFFIEISLSIHNPFVESKSAEIDVHSKNAEIDSSFEIIPEDYKKKRSVFFISTFQGVSKTENFNLEDILRKLNPETYYKVSYLKSSPNFIIHYNYLKKVLSENTPNTLVVEFTPFIMNSIFEIPGANLVVEENDESFLASKSNILKSIKSISGNDTDIDSGFYFDPFTASLSYKDSFPELSEEKFSEMEKEVELISENLKKLNKFCKNEGIKLLVITKPMLWSTSQKDRYSKLPLDKIVISNREPSFWYAEIYETMVNDIIKKLPNDVQTVDLSSVYPKDSRFYIDGFFLNNKGETFYSNMLLGRIELNKSIREVFE